MGAWLLGLMLFTAVGWTIRRSKGLHNYHKNPMLCMVLGLMLACGLAGWYSTAALGGQQAVWLSCWEIWTFLHLLAACNPTALSNILSPAQSVSHQPFEQPHAEIQHAARPDVNAQRPLHIAGSPVQQAGASQLAGVHSVLRGFSTKHLSLVWQHCKKPLFCILMGLVIPVVTGWVPFQFSSAQPAMPAVALRQTVPQGGLEWVDIPLEPHW